MFFARLKFLWRILWGKQDYIIVIPDRVSPDKSEVIGIGVKADAAQAYLKRFVLSKSKELYRRGEWYLVSDIMYAFGNDLAVTVMPSKSIGHNLFNVNTLELIVDERAEQVLKATKVDGTKLIKVKIN